MIVDIQVASDSPTIPDAEEIASWVNCVLRDQHKPDASEISIRVVDEAEIAELNESYRNKTGPTNVLSFPFEAPPGLPEDDAALQDLLGDVIICAPVVAREALEQDKTNKSHWAHMVVHGTLHLLGYDHQTDQQAGEMESLEQQLLSRLDFPNPYQEQQEQAR
jgi:probable rRNA maturation factor